MKASVPNHTSELPDPTGGIVSMLMVLWAAVLMMPGMSFGDGSDALEYLYPKQLHYGVLNTLKGVDHNDARVAVQMNFDRLSDIIDPNFRVTLDFPPDIETAARSIQQKKLHAFSTTGIDYLHLRKLVAVSPLAVASKTTGSPTESMVLLARRTTSLEGLSDMPQRRLIVDNNDPMDIGRIWLETELAAKGLPPGSRFFTSIQVAGKPIRMVLPVFFGQAELCLVPESAFETMKELNPQIGLDIHVLLRSPGFIKDMTCIADYLHPDFVDQMRSTILDMHNSETGRQLLIIFQLRRFFTFRPEHFQETERVFQKYEKMKSGPR